MGKDKDAVYRKCILKWCVKCVCISYSSVPLEKRVWVVLDAVTTLTVQNFESSAHFNSNFMKTIRGSKWQKSYKQDELLIYHRKSKEKNSSQPSKIASIKYVADLARDYNLLYS